MKRPKRAVQLSPRTAAIILTLALIVVGTVEWKALLAKERRENPGQVVTLAYCISCHSDDKMLKRMRYKSGDPLFLDKVKAQRAACPANATARPGNYSAASQWIEKP